MQVPELARALREAVNRAPEGERVSYPPLEFGMRESYGTSRCATWLTVLGFPAPT